MNKRYLMLGVLGLGLAQGLAHAAGADALQLVMPNKAGVSPEHAMAEIRVDGERQDGPYDAIANKTVDYIVAVRGDKHKKAIGDPYFSVRLESGFGGQIASGVPTKDWKYYAVSTKYVEPHSDLIMNQTVSPVALCNEKLKATSGAARESFLQKGTMFLLKDAYVLHGRVETEVSKVIGFSEFVEDYETLKVPAQVTCLPLERPRVRHSSTTKPAPKPQGKKMKPTISDVSLRVEPAKVVQMGQYLCPSQLKLYGHLETIRDFTGKSIFMGIGYLSPVTEIKMSDAGTRNMVGTYTMKWSAMGGLAAAPNAAPKKQSLAFRFNVSNKDGKVLESAERKIEVSCKKIAVGAPTSGTLLQITN